MILSVQSTVFQVDTFIAGLQKARQGVFRVFIKSANVKSGTTAASSFCTGWLLTDRLIVMPAYAVSSDYPNLSFTCHQQGAVGKAIALEADLLYFPINEPGIPAIGPALLQLRQPLPDAALTLQSRSSEVGETLILLQFASGNPAISFSTGNISELTDGKIHYNADTMPGSGGAPLFNLNWEVIGFHHSSRRELNANEGSTLSVLLDKLRVSPAWPDIVKYHRLADLAATVAQPETVGSLDLAPTTSLLKAAVCWNFDPEEFSEEDKEVLETMVLDSSDTQWILHLDERQRLLKEAGSLSALRKARGTKPSENPRQAVIDRLLKGKAVDLETVTEYDLPYWLQAVHWFAGVIPGLPSPQMVSQTLERRRIRSQFEPIAGTTFRGRVDELAQFQTWFDKPKAGPLVVSGIGGVGKSSLVARFALSLPADTLLLWLDFDRADLAPDDALSVMTLLNQQASVQLTDFRGPDLTKLIQQTNSQSATADQTQVSHEIQQALAELGQELCRSLVNTAPPLLVLDGFEVAQHVKQHDEIWHVLELLLAEIPELKIIVSGRAEVKGLKLLGRDAQPLDLKGISQTDADAWLLDQGITDAAVRERVLELANGVPLNLKLAVRLAKANGDLENLPQDLQKGMVTGYLYDRILDRVIDPLLKPTAQAALVLRKITPTLLEAVLPDALPKGLNAAEVFDRLTQELALVDASSVFAGTLPTQPAEKTLWIRPDVRNATLRLLEKDNEKRVREIDQRAADWYAKQNLADEVNAAELVYHRLRSGDVKAAKKAWLDACIPLLLNTEEDLWPNDKKEQEWLRKWLKRGNTQFNKLLAWEKEAVERIKRTQSRGLDRALYSILSEEKDRSEHSPLLFYDAWLRFTQGDLEDARDLLKNAADIESPVGRDQVVLAAQLAILANDRPAADRLLATVVAENRWADLPNAPMHALAVRAARIRLTVDIDAELKLIDLLEKPESELWQPEIAKRLVKSDVVLPRLQTLLEDKNSYILESLSISDSMTIPTTGEMLSEFKTQLANQRQQHLDPVWVEQIAKLSLSSMDMFISGSMIDHFTLDLGQVNEQAIEPLLNLALMGQQREERISNDLFLMEATKDLLTFLGRNPLSLSISATLMAMNGLNLIYSSTGTPTPINTLVAFFGKENDLGRQSYSDPLEQRSQQAQKVQMHEKEESQMPLLYLIGPDPLETLCRELLSLPDTFTF